MNYDDQFFIARHASSRESAEEIVPLLLDLIRPRSVIDVGCAIGEWLQVFREHGVEDIRGIDGDYVKEETLLIPPDRFESRDLRGRINIDRRFDVAMSLEVAEHLPESSAAEFIGSLVKLAPVVLFSAAIPHQGGTGHLNEQWQDYWAAHFESHGYLVIDTLRRRVWDNPRVARWYKQNMLLYVHADDLERHDDLRRERNATSVGPVSLVHPETYLKRAHPSTRRIIRMLKRRIAERWNRLVRGS